MEQVVWHDGTAYVVACRGRNATIRRATERDLDRIFARDTITTVRGSK